MRRGFEEAARTFAHSFTSAENLSSRDHAMTHLVMAALERSEPGFRADLRTGRIEPAALEIPATTEAVAHYVRWLPRFLAQHALPIRGLGDAWLEIRLALDEVRDPDRSGRELEVPFRCAVVLLVGGEEYRGEIEDVCTIPAEPRTPPRRFWWQFWRSRR